MPIQFHVKREGKTLVPFRKVDEAALEKLPERRPIAITASKPRSWQAQKLFHSVIAIACDNWPEGIEPNPEGNKELLRAWLECMAGPKWRRTIDFPVEVAEGIVALMRELAGDKYAFVKPIEVDGEPRLRVYVPKSTRYRQMDEAEFSPLRDEVFRIIEATLGVPIEQLLAEAAQNPEG